MCAPRVLPTVKVCDDSSALTDWRPPNVTHVMVFVRSLSVQETFEKPIEYQAFCCLAYLFEFSRAPNLRGRKAW